MTTLILGCGYLGRRVGRMLSERGERVFGTTRSPSRAAELAAWGVEPVVADVLDPSSLEALPTADRVLYCVGYDRKAGVPMRTVYVDGLANILRVLAHKTSRLIYVSATSVYGQNLGDWVDVDSPTGPTTESGRVCLDAEIMAKNRAEGANIALMIVRYSGLYGPDRLIGRKALLAGDPIVGDPAKYLNLIHIDDAASAAIRVLDDGAPGRLYLASDDHPTVRGTYYGQAAQILGAPAPRFEPAEGDGPAAPRDLSNKRVSNRRLKTELGFRLAYPDFRAGLRAILDAESPSRMSEEKV